MRAHICTALTLVLLAVSSVVDAGKLYPKCGGTNYSVAVGHKHNHPAVQLMNWTAFTSSMEIDCLAFEVVPPGVNSSLAIHTAAGKAQCTREYFESENPFRIFLQADLMGEDGKGSGTITTWDLDDLLGGSVNKMKYWNNGLSLWSIYFVNKDEKRCNMQLNMMVEAQPMYGRIHVHPSPGLVLVDPPTIYTKTPTLLGFNVIGGPSKGDRVRMRPSYDSERTKKWVELTRQTNGKDLAKHQLYNPVETAAFEFTEPKGGNYVVEYMRDLDGTGSTSEGSNVWVGIAHIVVYSSNPAYFRITKGAGPDGQLFLGKPTTLTFYGDNLNTNKNGDEVKFVDFSRECSASATAFHGVGSKNLGPGDENSTCMADWKFTLNSGGNIRACYKTATTGVWGEVVSYDDLDHLGPSTNAPFGSIPVPTHAVTGRKCNLAPISSTPSTAKTEVKLTLKGGDNFDHTMVTKLANALCIDPKAIQILSVGTINNHTQTVVSLDIVCHHYGNNFRCLGTERKDMLLFMWSNQYLIKELKELGISNVTSQLRGAEITTVYTYAPRDPKDARPPRPSAGHAAVVIFFILVILGGVFALGFVFRDKIKGAAIQGRGQFMALGTVDDDDDDNNTPHDANATTAPTATDGQAALNERP